jgi:uncharacterized protein (TIGR02145 family)
MDCFIRIIMLKNKSILTCLFFVMGFVFILLDSCSKENSTIITDNDGNVYHYVTIGTQVWTVENLKTKKFGNGELIGTTTPATLDISNEDSPKYQWAFGGYDTSATKYGRLYTWYTVTDNRNICPAGWHVPSDAEWTTLTTYLGGESVAGGKLKETGITHWLTPNIGATNESGFLALPGGSRDYGGSFGNYRHAGTWWSSTSTSALDAFSRSMYHDETSTDRSANDKHFGFSVRCVKDN